MKARAYPADQEATEARNPTRAHGATTDAGSGQPSGSATRGQAVAAYGQANATLATASREGGASAGGEPLMRPVISLLA